MNLNIGDVATEDSIFSPSDEGNGTVCSAPCCWVEDSPPPADRRGVRSSAAGDSGRGVLFGSAMMNSFIVRTYICFSGQKSSCGRSLVFKITGKIVPKHVSGLFVIYHVQALGSLRIDAAQPCRAGGPTKGQENGTSCI